IQGVTTGLSGILMLGGGALHIENCRILRFNSSSAGFGIDFTPSATASLTIEDSTIADNGVSGTTIGGGVRIASSGGAVTATLTNVRLLNNSPFGLRVEDNTKATVIDSVASGNGRGGFVALSTGAPAVLELLRSVSSNNASGISTNGALAQIHMAYTAVFDNT